MKHCEHCKKEIGQFGQHGVLYENGKLLLCCYCGIKYQKRKTK
jgi:hypothetical protein